MNVARDLTGKDGVLRDICTDSSRDGPSQTKAMYGRELEVGPPIMPTHREWPAP